MNKKLLIIGLFAFSIGAKAQGDLNLQLRHIKGIKGLDFIGGIGKDCYNVEISYFNFLSDVFYLRTSLNFEKTTFPSVVLNDYVFKPSLNYTLFKLGQSVFVNAEAGAFAGIESNTQYVPADNKTYIYPAAGKLIYGGVLGANIEVYLNGNVSLIGSILQYYIKGSDYGNWKYQLNGGFRFIIN